jgi:hypothetical protein
VNIKYLLFFLCLFHCLLAEDSLISYKENIGDLRGALLEVEKLLVESPSQDLLEKKIKLLSETAGFQKTYRYWDQHRTDFELNEKTYRKILESICWAKLKEGFFEGSLESRRVCLIAAALQNDVQALIFISQGLKSQNQWMRNIAAQLSANYLDSNLWEQIKAMFSAEMPSEWMHIVINLVGKIPLKIWEGDLEKLVRDKNLSQGVYLSAIEALMSMQGDLQAEDLDRILEGRKEFDKNLFEAKALATFNLKPSSAQVLRLLEQNSEELVILTCRSLMLLDDFQIESEVESKLRELQKGRLHSSLAVSSLLLLKKNDQTSRRMIKERLFSKKQNAALLACAYAKLCGPLLLEEMKEALEANVDIYVKANLVYSVFLLESEEKMPLEKLSKNLAVVLDEGSFSPVSHFFPFVDVEVLVPYGFYNSFASEDRTHQIQVSKLELLQLWASKDPKEAKKYLELFLSQLSLKNMHLAMELSLTEQLYNHDDLLKEMLDSENEKVKLEAAILLAHLRRDKEVIRLLHQSYEQVDYKRKFRILEALFAVAEKESWDFLESTLKEPYGQLSYIAAAGLLKSLSR